MDELNERGVLINVIMVRFYCVFITYAVCYMQFPYSRIGMEWKSGCVHQIVTYGLRKREKGGDGFVHCFYIH